MAGRRPKKPAEADEDRRVQVSLDADLARKGRVVAGFLGVSLPDLVNARLRPIIETELKVVLKELAPDGQA